MTNRLNPILSEDFLLSNDFARRMYHDYAKSLPIIDYHNHLPPADIAGNRQFSNLTQLWLQGDHYKWRAMRTLGIDERYITGNATDEEKFEKWSYAVPFTLRNPLYHWTHLELNRYFGIESLLNTNSASTIYQACTESLAREDYRVQPLLKRMNVEVICTTDDPADDLESHLFLQRQPFGILTLPAFRPDRAYAVEDPVAYGIYLSRLARVAKQEINSFDTLMAALNQRIEFFHSAGCRLADHGLEQLYFKSEKQSADKILQKVLNGEKPDEREAQYFKYATVIELCKIYHSKGWVQQFHLGALRNNNARMMEALGPDMGFDSIGDFNQASTLSRFLSELDANESLSKTILYNLNPAYNEVFATMVGNFNGGSIKGKIQFGSAWWFLDQKDGMEKQLNTLSNMGLISCFIGMLTDSRSFMSFPRHEYFRRILCNLFGEDVERGELPADEKWIGQVIADICYHNAKAYFNFGN